MRRDLDALFRVYIESMRERRYSARTQEHAERLLPRFFDYLRAEGVHDALKVRELHLVGFGRHLSSIRSKAGKPLALGTQAQYLAVVKAFFGFLERRRVLLVNPAASVPLPVRRRLPRAVSEAAARRLVSVPDPRTIKGRRDRTILELLYGTGLRMSECARLDLTDVDLGTGSVLVRDGKGRKDRVVPLAGRAREALTVYLARSRPELARWSDEAALFLARTGGRLSTMSLRVLVRTYGEHAGVKTSCHVLRHSYATHLLQGGANVREIQKLLGHRRIATTALYTRVDVHGLADMLRRCHPREKGAVERKARHLYSDNL